MNFTSFALRMYPMWILGAIVIGLVLAAGQKELLRIKKGPIFKWLVFLGIITVYRVVLSKIFDMGALHAAAKIAIPWPVALTVFWEDICHGLPLVLVQKLIGESKWTKPLHWLLMGGTMLAFGLGHTYQGVFAAVLLSFYIPYSVQMGKKHGFGTVIVCHMLYDLVTMLFVKFMFGA